MIRNRPQRETLAVALLFTAGIATRILSAWRYRHITNLDAGVVALMAKHIAEGSRLPVFFYGQAHMGSLEALLSALFCRLLGTSGFAVNLGTALVACGLLPVVYFWTKIAAGPRAAALALSLCIIGPGGFFHYNGSPRGGYAAALTLGTLVLLLATRTAIHLRQPPPPRPRDIFLLGLAAGLAWWSSQLTTASILAAALLLLAASGFRPLRCQPAAGLAGFFAGSAPLWIYNLTHNWATFAFGNSFQPHLIPSSLKAFFLERIPSLFFPSNAPAPLNLLLAALFLSLLPAAVLLLLHARKHHNIPLLWTLSALLLFTLVFATLYAASHFSRLNTPRYALPLVAPAAILLGILLAPLPARIAPLPALALIALQTPILFDRQPERSGATLVQSVEAFGTEALSRNTDLLYAHITRRSWNFLLRESVTFAAPDTEFHRPSALRAESAPAIAVLDNLYDAVAFTHRVNAPHDQFQASGISAQTDFRFPATPLTRLPDPAVASIHVPHTPENLAAPFLSGTLLPACQTLLGDTPLPLRITFHHPVRLAGLDLWPETLAKLPALLSLTATRPDGSTLTLLEPSPITPWFYSGPRLYYNNPDYRLQLRFPPTELTALTLHLQNPAGPRELSLLHLDLFQPAPRRNTPLLTPETLLPELHRLGITRLYADRFDAQRIAQISQNHILTSRHPELYPESAALPRTAPALDPQTALLVPAATAPLVREALAHHHLALPEHPLPPWVLFTAPEPITLTGLTWTGQHLLRDDAAYALDLWKQGNHTEAAALHPHLVPPPPPQTPLDLHFHNGVRLKGFDLTPNPDRTLTLRYHWQLPPGLNPHDLAVFVHFHHQRTLFQDDHVFMEGIPLLYLNSPPEHGEYVITRTVPLPADLPEDPLDIRLGLYHRTTHDRIPVRTRLPRRKHAVTLTTFSP